MGESKRRWSNLSVREDREDDGPSTRGFPEP